MTDLNIKLLLFALALAAALGGWNLRETWEHESRLKALETLTEQHEKRLDQLPPGWLRKKVEKLEEKIEKYH